MLFDTLLEDYSPLNQSGEKEPGTGEENEAVVNESKSKPKVRARTVTNEIKCCIVEMHRKFGAR